jgi:hypothetical protein
MTPSRATATAAIPGTPAQSHEHALIGTLQDERTLRLSNGRHIAVSVVSGTTDRYTVVLHDSERGILGGEEAQVTRESFSADPLSAAESLTLEAVPYIALDRVAGHISLSLRRLPVSEIDWSVLLAVSHVVPVPGLALAAAVQSHSILQHDEGRLVRGAVIPVVLETRDSSPDCQTYYTHTRSYDVPFDVLVRDDLVATVERIERGRERIDERCQW